jgi:hypothetical protein
MYAFAFPILPYMVRRQTRYAVALYPPTTVRWVLGQKGPLLEVPSSNLRKQRVMVLREILPSLLWALG